MHLVLFDCDGTLIDSQNQIVASVARAFDWLGLPRPSRADVLATVGLSLPTAFTRLLAPYPGVDPIKAAGEYRQAAADMHRAGAPEPLFEGAREVLDHLYGRGDVRLGIVTGKGRRGLDAMLEDHDLKHYFAVTKSADDAPSKPDPTMVRDAAGEVGIALGSTVVVGDTTFDLAMARRAGVASVGVSWGYHPAVDLADYAPLAVVDRFSDLLPVLDGFFKSGA